MFIFFKPNIEKLKTRGNVKGLIRALEYEMGADIVTAAADALGEMKCKDAVGPLISLLNRNDSKTREAALKALGCIGDLQVVSRLTKLLGSLSHTKSIDKNFTLQICKTLNQLNWNPGIDQLALKYYLALGKLSKFRELEVEVLLTELGNEYDIYDKKKRIKIKQGILEALVEKGETGIVKIIEYLSKPYFEDDIVQNALLKSDNRKLTAILEEKLYSCDGNLRRNVANILEKKDKNAVSAGVRSLCAAVQGRWEDVTTLEGVPQDLIEEPIKSNEDYIINIILGLLPGVDNTELALAFRRIIQDHSEAQMLQDAVRSLCHLDPCLLGLLKRRNFQKMRHDAARCLCTMGTTAAIYSIISIIEDEREHPTCRIFMEYLPSMTKENRLIVIKSIEELNSKSKPFINILQWIISNSDLDVCIAAEATLAKMEILHKG